MTKNDIKERFIDVKNFLRGHLDDLFNHSGISAGFFAYVGVVIAVFIPVTIFMLQDNAIIDVDYLVISDAVVGLPELLEQILMIAFLSLAFLIMNSIKRRGPIRRFILLVLLSGMIVFSVRLGYHSTEALNNAFNWLYDVPSFNDNNPSSTPVLDNMGNVKINTGTPLSEDDSSKIMDLIDIGTRKQLRLAYLRCGSVSMQQKKWSMLWDDSKTYEFLARDDFAMYAVLYLAYAQKGFLNFSNHMIDFYNIEQVGVGCSIIQPLLFGYANEHATWRKKMWLNAISEYVKAAVTDDSEKRFDKYECWFGTLAYYVVVSPTVVGDAELDELSKVLWQLFKTDGIYREMPEVIKRVQPNVAKFYRLISETNSYSEFGEEIRKEISNNCDNLMKETLEFEKCEELGV